MEIFGLYIDSNKVYKSLRGSSPYPLEMKLWSSSQKKVKFSNFVSVPPHPPPLSLNLTWLHGTIWTGLKNVIIEFLQNVPVFVSILSS